MDSRPVVRLVSEAVGNRHIFPSAAPGVGFNGTVDASFARERLRILHRLADNSAGARVTGELCVTPNAIGGCVRCVLRGANFGSEARLTMGTERTKLMVLSSEVGSGWVLFLGVYHLTRVFLLLGRCGAVAKCGYSSNRCLLYGALSLSSWWSGAGIRGVCCLVAKKGAVRTGNSAFLGMAKVLVVMFNTVTLIISVVTVLNVTTLTTFGSNACSVAVLCINNIFTLVDTITRFITNVVNIVGTGLPRGTGAYVM